MAFDIYQALREIGAIQAQGIVNAGQYRAAGIGAMGQGIAQAGQAIGAGIANRRERIRGNLEDIATARAAGMPLEGTPLYDPSPRVIGQVVRNVAPTAQEYETRGMLEQVAQQDVSNTMFPEREATVPQSFVDSAQIPQREESARAMLESVVETAPGRRAAIDARVARDRGAMANVRGTYKGWQAQQTAEQKRAELAAKVRESGAASGGWKFGDVRALEKDFRDYVDKNIAPADAAITGLNRLASIMPKKADSTIDFSKVNTTEAYAAVKIVNQAIEAGVTQSGEYRALAEAGGPIQAWLAFVSQIKDKKDMTEDRVREIFNLGAKLGTGLEQRRTELSGLAEQMRNLYIRRGGDAAAMPLTTVKSKPSVQAVPDLSDLDDDIEMLQAFVDDPKNQDDPNYQAAVELLRRAGKY